EAVRGQSIRSDGTFDNGEGLFHVAGFRESADPLVDLSEGLIDNFVVALDRSQRSTDFVREPGEQLHEVVRHAYFSATAASRRTRWTSCLKIPCAMSTWSDRTS